MENINDLNWSAIMHIDTTELQTKVVEEKEEREKPKESPFTTEKTSRKHVSEMYAELKEKYGIPDFFDAFVGGDETDYNTRDLQFYSSLVTLSGFATNNYVQYNGKKNALNLFMSVVGKAAAGKGAMAFPKKVLLSNLDKWYGNLNQIETDRYNSDKKCADKSDDYQRVNKPMNFQTTIERPTAAYIVNTLYDNNNKCMFYNNEMGSVADADRGNYGGFNAMLRNIYDNDDISNETNNNKREGYANRVYNAAMSMLISGTPAQAKNMFGDIENGLVSRFMTYFVDDKEYEFPALYKRSVNYDDIELMFLNWHIENMCGTTKNYVISDEDYHFVAEHYKDNIPKLCKMYNDGTIIGDAIKATLLRFPMYVFRVAALLQSIDNFERTHRLVKGKKPTLYLYECDANMYIEHQRQLNSHFIDNDNLLTIGDQLVPLDCRWIECADVILRPLLSNHINFLLSYAGRDADVNTVIPRKLNVLYQLEDEFSFTEYWKVYFEQYQPRSENAAKTFAKTALKQLVEEDYVEKLENGYRKLLK